jgi:hypothetical protein
MCALRMPKGEVYVDEVMTRNCISITDNPDKEEITSYFKMYKNAEKLIYVRGNFRKEFLRENYIKEEVK